MRRFAAWGGAAVAALAVVGCASVEPESPVAASASYADFLIGRLASTRQDNDIAADRYFRALQRAPGDPSLINGALLAALGAGDIERARRAAAMAPMSADAPAYANLVRGSDAIVAGRWRQADTALGRVEGGAAEELVGRMLTTWTLTAQDRLDRVVMDLGPLASLRPYGGLFAYQQAMALDYAGRQDDALAAYERGAVGGLWLPDAIERHADLLARRGDRTGARALLGTEINRQNPALAAALARLDAGGAVATRPLSPALGASSGMYGLATIFFQENDTQNALAALTLSMLLDPQADAARVSFAQAQSDQGRIDLARAMLARVAPESPYAGGARRLEAWMLLNAGQEDEAFALARQNAASGDARAVRALADMYRNRRHYTEAEPLYSQLLASTQDDWRIYFSRGAVRERLGRWSDAEADFRHALVLSPNQPDVMNYLGYSWIDRGEHVEEALGMIQRAVELRPTSGAVIDSLGWAYFRLGEYERALDYLERAVELEPADSILNEHLGDAYWRLGRRIEARFQWRRALSLEPEDADALNQKLEHGLPPEPAQRAVSR